MFFGLNDVAFLAAVAGGAALDPDAAAYIAAVEAADTQALEPAVRAAINDFVVGCKADGIWNAIKASCILAGARTLSGALVPLVGAAPTNVGGLFVSGDYNRKTGLKGDGSTKYLNSNRANNADPQNNHHLSIYVTSSSVNDRFYIGAVIIGNFSGIQTTSAGQLLADSRVPTANRQSFSTSALTGFIGATRPSSVSYSYRGNNVTTSNTATSVTPSSDSVFISARNTAGPSLYSDGRLAFYSIGESLDLALLDARVTTLVNAFAAAIP
jgi:hypothetical protein